MFLKLFWADLKTLFESIVQSTDFKIKITSDKNFIFLLKE